MTTEEKELLLKDLCVRLPYGVHLFTNSKHHIRLLTISNDIDYDEQFWINGLYDIDEVKPYLRPMSSMTEEEKEEMHNLLSPEGTAIYENDGIVLPINHCGEFVPYEFMNCIIQYLLKNHFDFMELIPKGLAIEVTKENNPYEEH